MAKIEYEKKERPLDWTDIILRQLERMNDALDKGERRRFITNVEGLNRNMHPYWDEEYKKGVEEAKEAFFETTDKIPNPGSEKDKAKRFQAEYERAAKIHIFLIDLIHRSKFLPFKKVFGVVDI